MENRLSTLENRTSIGSTNDENYRRDAPKQNRQMGSYSFGKAADLPAANYMANQGIGSALYFATDTNKLYSWNGTSWVSASLS